jgi:hypothetical protein
VLIRRPIIPLPLAFGLTALAALSASAPALSAPPDPADTAKAAADAALAKYGSPEAFDENAASPLTAGSLMTSVDGTASFSQPVSCLSSESFLRLFFGPGPGGDIAPVVVSQDTNFDGTLDASQTLPFAVSGICSNGVIACNAGSWTGCQGYSWQTVSPVNHQIALTPTPLTGLQACTCVNNSCGSGLVVSNQAQIGQTLASGMAAALQRTDPRYSLSAVGQTPFQVTLSGQDTTSCTATPTLTQTDYYSNPAGLTPAGQAAAGADPLYTQLTSRSEASGFVTTTPACTIERQLEAGGRVQDVVQAVTSSDVTFSTVSDNEYVIEIGKPTAVLTLGETCNVGHIWSLDLQITDPLSLQSVMLEAVEAEDHSQLHIDGAFVYALPSDFTNYSGAATGTCNHATDWYDSPNLDLTSYFTDGLNHTLRIRTVVGNQGHSYYRIRVRTNCRSEIKLTNTCGGLAASDSCRVLEETVDGVQTYLNGGKTGLLPLSSARTAGAGACQVTVNQDWWDKDRTYECTNDTSTPPVTPPNLDRMTYILENSDENGWQDRRSDGAGGFTTSSGSYDYSAYEVAGDCELSCKVERPSVVDGVTVTGLQASARNSTSSNETVFKTCNVSGACPLLPGETLVADCACLDDFPEALVAMQAMRLGGLDQFCTTGATSPW